MTGIKKAASQLKAVDFFCSGGGMTSGFRKAGINVLGGIDIDPQCEKTYTFNNPKSKFILSDIKELTFDTLSKELNIKKDDDNLIFIGCSPCQYWSKMKTIKTKSEDSKDLLKDFQRFVKHFRPGHVTIENVPGILKSESPLKSFLRFLKKERYRYKYEIVDASHYGVPQTRKRFLLVASRVNKNVSLPDPVTKEQLPTVRQFIGNKKIFKTIKAGHRDKTDFLHTALNLSQENMSRLKLTPHDGGSRKAWSKTKLQIPAYVGKDDSFQDIYGRMYWDKPGPTITTKFNSISNGRFGHPEQNRAISLREGATLQTFDINYRFFTDSFAAASRIIGNAVPPEMAKNIARALIKLKT